MKMRRERGFTVADMLIATAILAGFILLTALNYSRPPKVHPAALVLQAALAEGRTLAMSYSRISNVRGGAGFTGLDGATVTITPDPLNPSDGSIIAVWRSRPRTSGDPLIADSAYPPQHVPVRFTSSSAGAEPFSILISSAGYASIARAFPDALPPPNALEADPGCNDDGESIAVSDGTQNEKHRFECREGLYDASASAP